LFVIHVGNTASIKCLRVIALPAINARMNSKHRKTLEAIFARPTTGALKFSAIESLLLSLGAELHESEGSRVKFTWSGEAWHAHRPHPGKEAKKYQVEGVREFLERNGVTP
jgi:hypothetical protein